MRAARPRCRRLSPQFSSPLGACVLSSRHCLIVGRRASIPARVSSCECEAMGKTPSALVSAGDRPPTDYDRPPTHSKMARDMDVMVPMRDGVKLCVDIYRPDAPGTFPALLAFAIYNTAQGLSRSEAPLAPAAAGHSKLT